MRPDIQYVRTSDGVNIAFYEMGEGPPLVVTSPVLFSHLRFRFIREYHRDGRGLGRFNRIIRYDARGTGLSDRTTLDFSLDARVCDLETVVDHLGLDSFDLYGFVNGGPTTIGYAARHPDRVAHLVLVQTYANGADQLADLFTRANLMFQEALGDRGWDYFTLMLANQLFRFRDSATAERLAAVYREATTPESYRAFHESLAAVDVRPLLAQISVPALAIHRQWRDVVGIGLRVPIEWMREIASAIPRCRFVPRPVAGDDVEAWLDAEYRIVEEFLGVGEAQAGAAAVLPSGTAIILFADIVDSTGLTERLGDTAFRNKARGLDEAMRAAIRDIGGTAMEGKTLGDGVLAVFTSAKQAIACSQACHKAAGEAGLALHAGIHAGDVIREADNVYGGAVNIAARIAAASAAGETLVSETVRSLARTSAGVVFEDRGEQALKGIGETVRVWAVRKGGE